MTMATRIAIVLLAACIAALPAKAATTVFGGSVFSSTNTTTAGAAIGPADGAAALIGPSGDLVLQYDLPLTGAGLAVSLLPTTGFNVLAISIGEVVSGVATFSGEFVLVDGGAGGVLGAELTSACSALSPNGCSLIKLRNAGSLAGSAGVLVDSIGGVTAAPEPAAWALMILAFAGVAGRSAQLKKRRGRDAVQPHSILKGAAPAV